MKKLLLGLIVFGAIGLVEAGQTFTDTISSTSLRGQVFLLNPKESLTYSMTGTAVGTIVFEKSLDGANFKVLISSVNNSGGTLSGTERSENDTAFYRWRASTMTGSGTFLVSIADNEDFVSEFFSNKKTSIFKFFDDSVRILASKVALGDTSVVPSTSTTSGNSDGLYRSAYLTGATAAIEGSVLVATTPVNGQGSSVMVAPATADFTGWVGIAKGAAASGSIVEYYYSGFVLALTTGTVNAGDTLVTSNASAGYLAADTTPTTGADVGVAMSAGTAAGGRTKIRLR